MKVEVVKRELDFYVLEVKSRTDDKGKEFLKWDSSKASYFILIKLKTDFDIDKVKSNEFTEKLCKKLEESFDLNGKPYQGEIELNDVAKFNIISLNQYKRTNRWYYEPSPMKVVVLCGELKNDTLRIHMPDDIISCSTFVPEKVNVSIVKETQLPSRNGLMSGFRRIFGQNEQPTKEIYEIRISSLSPNYKNGLYYRIKGNKVSYPVTKKMSSSAFKIEVPIGKELEFFVEREKIKEYVLSVK